MSQQFYEEGDPATGRKILLATPCYGSPAAAYTFSIARSREALRAAGIQSAYLLLQNNPHVDDARNSIVRDFLASDCTELLFLDADVHWEPSALVQLCGRDLDVVGGVYPYRREGSENMPVRLKADTKPVGGLLEVEGLPTGFLKIKRHVLELMASRAPKYFDSIFETALVFDRPAPGADKARWGGDIDFCNRWRALGGKLYADMELSLGHTATLVLKDSLGAHIRRLSGTALDHIAPKLRAGTETESDYNELFRYGGNNWAADPGVLALVTGVARKCRGPIIEVGSGLSSICMALVSDSPVYSLEHVDHYAAQTLAWAQEASLSNLGICCAPLKDFWYDLDKFELPKKFALGFCDGPPRMYGTRTQFLETLAPRCSVVIVDDIKQDHNYAKAVYAWAEANDRTVTIFGRAALIAKESLWQKAA